MGYQKSDGVVTLTMTVADYERILMAIGTAAGCASRDGLPIAVWLGLSNRINEGNPNWTPYTSSSIGASKPIEGLERKK